MLRDVLVMEVPLVLKADFYATATIIGGILFTALFWIGMPLPIAYCHDLRGHAGTAAASRMEEVAAAEAETGALGISSREPA